jgi:hypothetical protein
MRGPTILDAEGASLRDACAFESRGRCARYEGQILILVSVMSASPRTRGPSSSSATSKIAEMARMGGAAVVGGSRAQSLSASPQRSSSEVVQAESLGGRWCRGRSFPAAERAEQ